MAQSAATGRSSPGESFDALRDNVRCRSSRSLAGDAAGPPKKNAEGYLWRFATGAEAVFMSYQQDVRGSRVRSGTRPVRRAAAAGDFQRRAPRSHGPPRPVVSVADAAGEAWILDELIRRGRILDSLYRGRDLPADRHPRQLRASAPRRRRPRTTGS